MQPPQGIAALLEESLVVYKGVTDADGNVLKTTLKCSDIGSGSAYPDFDGNQIILTSGSYKGQARDINGATNGDVAGTITVANAFDGKIVSGTSFIITGIRTVPAEVAALQADVGDASASSLGSLYAILGNPIIPVYNMLGALDFYGKVTTFTNATTFKASGLAGLGNDFFNGYYIYVLRDAAGAGAAPQGELQPITAYTSSDGTFTHTAFTVNLTVNDEILLVNPRFADLQYLVNKALSSPAADSIGEKITNIETETDKITKKLEVQEVVIYPAAEDRAATELDGDGTSPNYLAESSQLNADEAAGMSSPAWTEDIDFESAGTITIIAIYAELRWKQKQTGGGTSTVKMQISGDGGSSWMDISNDVTETGTSYVDKTRAGVGRWITAITAGTNQLQVRLVQWGGTTSSEVALREDTYLRLTYRKS